MKIQFCTTLSFNNQSEQPSCGNESLGFFSDYFNFASSFQKAEVNRTTRTFTWVQCHQSTGSKVLKGVSYLLILPIIIALAVKIFLFCRFGSFQEFKSPPQPTNSLPPQEEQPDPIQETTPPPISAAEAEEIPVPDTDVLRTFYEAVNNNRMMDLNNEIPRLEQLRVILHAASEEKKRNFFATHFSRASTHLVAKNLQYLLLSYETNFAGQLVPHMSSSFKKQAMGWLAEHIQHLFVEQDGKPVLIAHWAQWLSGLRPGYPACLLEAVTHAQKWQYYIPLLAVVKLPLRIITSGLLDILKNDKKEQYPDSFIYQILVYLAEVDNQSELYDQIPFLEVSLSRFQAFVTKYSAIEDPKERQRRLQCVLSHCLFFDLENRINFVLATFKADAHSLLMQCETTLFSRQSEAGRSEIDRYSCLYYVNNVLVARVAALLNDIDVGQTLGALEVVITKAATLCRPCLSVSPLFNTTYRPQQAALLCSAVLNVLKREDRCIEDVEKRNDFFTNCVRGLQDILSLAIKYRQHDSKGQHLYHFFKAFWEGTKDGYNDVLDNTLRSEFNNQPQLIDIVLRSAMDAGVEFAPLPLTPANLTRHFSENSARSLLRPTDFRRARRLTEQQANELFQRYLIPLFVHLSDEVLGDIFEEPTVEDNPPPESRVATAAKRLEIIKTKRIQMEEITKTYLRVLKECDLITPALLPTVVAYLYSPPSIAQPASINEDPET